MAKYSITPLGKPRMTRADKWKQRPPVLRYRVFCDEVRLSGITLPESGAHVVFVLPMPASWSQKKRASMSGAAHQQKPDIDNLTKSLLDALFDDDAHIWDIRSSKIWGYEGAIVVQEGGA
ncbi:RusA family crossover junction endodeoxyribonuclease [Escherichia coli]|nr:RusA family crossover junction endodeoxyribonuclease [Escherichia coli]MEB5674148.1 RusA family crossover junction endodeoxyribonuclease [Escherichia coli]